MAVIITNLDVSILCKDCPLKDSAGDCKLNIEPQESEGKE